MSNMMADGHAVPERDDQRTVKPGDLVKFSLRSGVLWEVQEVEVWEWGAVVQLRSQRSGLRRNTIIEHLCWPDTGERCAARDRPPQQPEQQARLEPPPWGPDEDTAAVIEWHSPVDDGKAAGPSAVTICLSEDERGTKFLGVLSDGDGHQVAYLGANAARQLALAILKQTRHM